MNSYSVDKVVRHPNGRCEVFLTSGNECQVYGVVPGSQDKSPLHQDLERRISAGEFTSITKEFVPAMPGAAPSVSLDELKRMLAQQVVRDYTARSRDLFDAEAAFVLEEARLWLTEAADVEAPDPDPHDYPLLAAVAMQYDDIQAAAADVVMHARQSKTKLAHLMKAKSTGLGLINSAQTADEAESHFAAIDWGE